MTDNGAQLEKTAHEHLRGNIRMASVGGQLRERFGDLDGFDGHIGQMSMRIVHHYLMGGWGLEDTPEPAVLLEDQVSL